MEKVTITLSFEKEKLDAMAVFLADENTTVQQKMQSLLQQLYEESVPADVRKFLEAKSNGGKSRRTAAAPRTRPASKPKTETEKEDTEHEQP